MQMYKRIRLTRNELEKLQQDCDGYIWAAIDPKKYAISLGDLYLADLRDILIVQRCELCNIYGIGLDMRTGEIDFVAQVNRRNPTVGVHGELSKKSKEEIVQSVRYFFDRLPAFRDSHEDEQESDDLNDTTIAFR